MARTAWILPAALAATASTVLADGSGGQIRLRGEVPAVCTVSVADLGVTLDLARPLDRVSVASVEERCNAAAGYSVSLTTLNGGQLRSDGGTTVPYSIAYEGAAAAGSTLVATRPASPLPQSRPLAVSATPPASVPAGSYMDTIVVTIAGR